MGGGASGPDPVEAESLGRGEEHFHDGSGGEPQHHTALAPHHFGDTGCLAQPADQGLARGLPLVHRDEIQGPDHLAAAPHRPGALDPQHPGSR